MNEYTHMKTAGIPDSEFIRSDVPMTKIEVRVLSIAKLQLAEGDRILDVGAGTGSVSIEIARLLPQSPVFAVEQKERALELIQFNAKKFQTPNVQVIAGKAPDAINGISDINKIFIGGSGGNLKEILEWVEKNSVSGARTVVNAITLDTLVITREFLKRPAFDQVEIVQVAVNQVEKVGGYDILQPKTQVFIISAVRV